MSEETINSERTKKKKPIGFIAICQCENIVGAMDLTRTDKKEAEELLNDWLKNGCMIKPKFEHNWNATISSCEC